MSLILTIVLWILQGMLAALMLFHGGMFVTLTPAREQRMMERRPGAKPFNLAPAFRLFIGVAELLAAIGLLLPGITHILPWLTPLAATGLLVVMIGAMIYHQQRGERSQVRGNLVIVLLLLIVALLRWFVLPL